MLTTVNTVKTSLQSAHGVTDALITRLIKQVTARIEGATERWLEYAARSEKLDGRKSEYLYLRGAPVKASSVTVTIDGEAATDFVVNLETGELYRENKWHASDKQGVVVAYTAGYDAAVGATGPPPPADLEGAVIAEVVAWFDTLKSAARTGQDIVDLKGPFLSAAVKGWIAANKMPRY